MSSSASSCCSPLNIFSSPLIKDNSILLNFIHPFDFLYIRLHGQLTAANSLNLYSINRFNSSNSRKCPAPNLSTAYNSEEIEQEMHNSNSSHYWQYSSFPPFSAKRGSLAPALLPHLTHSKINYYNNLYNNSRSIIRYDSIISAKKLGSHSVMRNEARKLANQTIAPILLKHAAPGHDYCLDINSCILLMKPADIEQEFLSTLISSGLCRSVAAAKAAIEPHSFIDIREWLFHHSRASQPLALSNSSLADRLRYKINKIPTTQRNSLHHNEQQQHSTAATTNWCQAQSLAAILYSNTMRDQAKQQQIYHNLSCVLRAILEAPYLARAINKPHDYSSNYKRKVFKFLSNFIQQPRMAEELVELYSHLAKLNCLHLLLQLIPYYQTLVNNYKPNH
jgi:hypothetical protein